MEVKKPTQEQIKEFWEWCEWYELPIELWNSLDVPLWKNGATQEVLSINCLPRIDLNNLFKYAVPKLDCYYLFNCEGEGTRLELHQAEVSIYDSNRQIYIGTATNIETPALALFWAIWEVIHGCSKEI